MCSRHRGHAPLPAAPSRCPIDFALEADCIVPVPSQSTPGPVHLQKELFTIKVNETGAAGALFRWSPRGDLLAVCGIKPTVQIYNRCLVPQTPKYTLLCEGLSCPRTRLGSIMKPSQTRAPAPTHPHTHVPMQARRARDVLLVGTRRQGDKSTQGFLPIGRRRPGVGWHGRSLGESWSRGLIPKSFVFCRRHPAPTGRSDWSMCLARRCKICFKAEHFRSADVSMPSPHPRSLSPSTLPPHVHASGPLSLPVKAPGNRHARGQRWTA